jgi:hypothetical protein
MSRRNAWGRPAGDRGLPFRRRPAALRSRINGRTIGIARPGAAGRLPVGDDRPNLRPAEKGRVEQAEPVQFCEHRPIRVEPVALPEHRLFPAEPQPGEILQDRGPGTPSGRGSGRCPPFAGESARRPRAPPGRSGQPSRHARGGENRSGSGRSGTRGARLSRAWLPFPRYRGRAVMRSLVHIGRWSSSGAST